MKKVIFSQVMTDNGTAEFSGVYDRNGLPVKIILEADDDGIVLTAVRCVTALDISRISKI